MNLPSLPVAGLILISFIVGLRLGTGEQLSSLDLSSSAPSGEINEPASASPGDWSDESFTDASPDAERKRVNQIIDSLIGKEGEEIPAAGPVNR